MSKVLTMVLAGGEGKRLAPLTADRAKPAVPFGGNYRLIDFALSNLVNANYHQIVVLTQYKSHSLDRHVTTTWRLSPLLGNYVTPVPAQMRLGPRWFVGSADAIYQNYNLIADEKPEHIIVFGADHIYRMDPRQMVEQHIASGKGVTVAALRAPIEQADQFGVIETAPNGRDIARFREKPKDAIGLLDAPDMVYASMGNYVFSTEALISTVSADANDPDSKHDLGGNIIPALVAQNDAQVYDFSTNLVPGATERDRGYWRDVGTLDAYYDAHMDLISVDPIFNMYNHEWPIHTWPEITQPAKFVFDEDGPPRPGAGLDGLRRRRDLRRHRAALAPVAAHARALVLAGRGLDPDARRPDRPQRGRAEGDPRQGGGDRRGRRDRRRSRGRRPRALPRVRGRDRRDPQGPAGRGMRVALMTREYPPEVYGGAGVHVEYLARELRAFEDVDVHCWGAPREDATAHQPWTALAGDAPELSALRAVSIDLTMAAGAADADITHTHTWYAQFGGHLAKLLYDIPHVATVHSLEPLRPWKEEQLGGGYRLSSFCEKTALENADAVIAVSNGTKRDILGVYPAIDPDRVHVIYNGIDTDEYTPDPRHRRARAVRHRSGQAVGRVRRADHAPEGRVVPARRRRATSTRARSSCCARARRTRRNSAPRSSRWWPSCARRARACSGSSRCCPSPR